ncbi:MAG: hypothetical protein KDI88_07695 [Gammaproteobacteria bacterium]|nr:hypothetical protein [Gammaproteobacteria bacterium]
MCKSAGDMNRPARMTGRLQVAYLVMLLIGTGVVVASDDDYLKLLDEEVTKVDGAGADGGGNPSPGTDGTASDRPPGNRQQFEDRLRDQHVGTYSFYRRLPERSRQEIFLDYQAGVPMDQLRDKVVERFLHP